MHRLDTGLGGGGGQPYIWAIVSLSGSIFIIIFSMLSLIVYIFIYVDYIFSLFVPIFSQILLFFRYFPSFDYFNLIFPFCLISTFSLFSPPLYTISLGWGGGPLTPCVCMHLYYKLCCIVFELQREDFAQNQGMGLRSLRLP